MNSIIVSSILCPCIVVLRRAINFGITIDSSISTNSIGITDHRHPRLRLVVGTTRLLSVHGFLLTRLAAKVLVAVGVH